MFALFLSLVALLTKADRPTSVARAESRQPLPALQGQPAVEYLKKHSLYNRLQVRLNAGAANDPCNQWTEIRKRTASDASTLRGFGDAVAISGDTVVISSPRPASPIGNVYIFERNQGGPDNWGEVKKLIADDGIPTNGFGTSIGISGDTIVIGSGATKAYLFGRNQGGVANWGLIRMLLGSDVGSSSAFGQRVGISGDTLLIGSPGGSFSGSALGEAFIFGRNQGGADKWGLVKKLTASNGVTADYFSNAVGISGDVVVIGASLGNSLVGAAYVYGRNVGGADNWGQVKILIPSDGHPQDDFGFSVGISGETVAVGAYGKDSRIGAGYVFERNLGGADNWGQARKLTVGGGQPFDKFGISIGISGDNIVVGATGVNSATGAAYVFNRNQGGVGNWGQVSTLRAADGMPGIGSGVSGDNLGTVAISGGIVIAGAPGKAVITGASYVFAAVCAPTFSQAFGAPNVLLNGTTSLSFTLTNPEPNLAFTGLAFSDALPAGLIIDTPANVTNSCGGTIGAIAGSGTISLLNGVLPAGGSCTISVNVKGTSVGAKVNTTSSLTSANGVTASGSTATLNVHEMKAGIGDPLVCNGPGGTVSVTATVTNSAATAQAADFTANLPAKLSAVQGTCAANVGNCVVANASTVTWNGTLAAGQTVTITYQAQFADDAGAGTQVCVTSSATVGGSPAGSVTACATLNCPAAGPGQPLAAASPMSDQKAGSVLIYNLYTSSADPIRQNTRLSITNTDPTRPAFVHLFFVDGASCSVADSYLCLTGNQTTTFLASDLDPGTTGYVVAVAVDGRGCPTNFNYLIGDEYVKLQSGHAANLAAQSVSALAGGLPACDANSSTAMLRFDGVSYNVLPHVLAADNLPSRADGNDTLLVLNRIGGNLGLGATTLSSLFGIFYNDTEASLSFSFTPGTCQFRSSISNNFPRLAPRFEQFVPAGRSGWFKIWLPDLAAMTGALINFNANTATSAGAFSQGHNLHALTTTTTAGYLMPVFPPHC
ncbi:MAG TPA: hypothetical protein PLD20_08045 [Blastocatellia bacterium]|nr:hypothetical protein [Blastocatellia bacterium]HMY73036.1 hypothetical protein [Blastocatellia bacterium]HMZ17865.1 hypothetical protein [Blastocatellia bacterium]HNG32389.1 hypothetical protein [Blastocatellia bacterium]